MLVDLNNELITFEWAIWPEISRGSCYEPVYGKWFGFTYQANEMSPATLWTICDISNPIPVQIDAFDETRVAFMIAFPYGLDNIRIIGFDALNNDLFYCDELGNLPPEAEFLAIPSEGRAPLSVDFMNHSSDCEGQITEIHADWNDDGITDEIIMGSPELIQHEFVDPGIHMIKLTVIDGGGSSDIWTTQIPVSE
jgi:PKD repeat protein